MVSIFLCAGKMLSFHWLIWMFSHQISALWTVCKYSTHWMFGAVGSQRKGVEVLFTFGDVCVCVCECVCVCVCVGGGVETMNQSEKKTNSKFSISFVTSPTQPFLQNPPSSSPPLPCFFTPCACCKNPHHSIFATLPKLRCKWGKGVEETTGGDREIHQRGGGVEILNISPSILHSSIPSPHSNPNCFSKVFWKNGLKKKCVCGGGGVKMK